MIVMPGIMRGRLTSHDGLLADFVNGIFYTKPGSNFANAQSMFSWSSSTKYTRNAAGVLVASGSNTPAYEWTNAGAALGVRVESSRTNDFQRSEDFANSYWTKSLSGGVTATAAAGTSPDGATTATNCVPNAVSGYHTVKGPNLGSSTSLCTYSIWAKANGYSTISIREDGVGGNSVAFDLSGGTVLWSGGGNISGTIEAWLNGWYRCTATSTVTGTQGFAVYILTSSYVSGDPSSPGNFFTGDGTSGVLLWGAQRENNVRLPSSYMPTTTASVTRNADVISRALSSEFSATAGTLLAHYSVPDISSFASDRVIASIDDGTANERFRYRIQATQADADFLVTDGGVSQADIDGPAITANTTVKAAMAWAANDFQLVVNGASAGTDVSGTLPTVTTLMLGSGPSGNDGLFGHLRRLEYWPSRLTQAEMIALTA